MRVRLVIASLSLCSSLSALAAEPTKTAALQSLAIKANRGINSKMVEVAAAKKLGASQQRARALSEEAQFKSAMHARYKELASVESRPEAKGLMTFLKGLERSQSRSWIVPLAQAQRGPSRESLVLTARGVRVYQISPHYHEQDSLEGPIRLRTPILRRINPSVMGFDIAQVRSGLQKGVEQMEASLKTQLPPSAFDAGKVFRLGYTNGYGITNSAR